MGKLSSSSQTGKKRRPWLIRFIRLLWFCHLAFWSVVAFFCLLYIFVNPPITPLMLQRYMIRGFDWHKREYIDLEKIPDSTVDMTIVVEDGNFYRHYGFAIEEAKRAWKRNKTSGKIRFGASTISNQVARTIFLTTDRNYLRKYLEAQVTVIMEILMTKNRMLELYLNYVEWGKGIYGIETASLYYYGRSCSRISRDQSMKLVSILSSPIKYSPQTYSRSASARQRYRMLNRYF
ncbi:MAG TPA: transglycosylase domain-containing protein [Candidatus Cloacimonadota bacterium]|nr:transglycosylase domain-containing protein [Candidatus Cloacimonadota bacterium]